MLHFKVLKHPQNQLLDLDLEGLPQRRGIYTSSVYSLVQSSCLLNYTFYFKTASHGQEEKLITIKKGNSQVLFYYTGMLPN